MYFVYFDVSSPVLVSLLVCCTLTVNDSTYHMSSAVFRDRGRGVVPDVFAKGFRLYKDIHWNILEALWLGDLAGPAGFVTEQ